MEGQSLRTEIQGDQQGPKNINDLIERGDAPLV